MTKIKDFKDSYDVEGNYVDYEPPEKYYRIGDLVEYVKQEALKEVEEDYMDRYSVLTTFVALSIALSLVTFIIILTLLT